jgi:iron-sulfur cluster assembly accessory protein
MSLRAFVARSKHAAAFMRAPHGVTASRYQLMPSVGMCSRPQKVLDELIVTPRAAAQIMRLNGENTKSTAAPTGTSSRRLRVAVEGGGCSGFQYTFALEECQVALNEDDLVFTRDGAEVVTDETSLEFIRGATVDYEEDLLRSSFAVVNNPNSESGCGCGTSFALKTDF